MEGEKKYSFATAFSSVQLYKSSRSFTMSHSYRIYTRCPETIGCSL